MPKSNGLTPKQAMFVHEYGVDQNGAQAAIRSGYSEHAAKEQASRLLTNANVREAVERAERDRATRLSITADRIASGIMAIAEDEEASRNEQLKAYELMGKHLSMFTDKMQHSGGLALSGGPFQIAIVEAPDRETESG